MDRIKLWDKCFRPYIDNAAIEAAVENVSDRLNAAYSDGNDIPIILCVLNGAIMFTASLMKRLSFPCQLVTVKLSSYSGTRSTGTVNLQMDLTADVSGRRVIIVEDIVDTGKTLSELRKILEARGAGKVEACTLLFKEEAFVEGPAPEYVGIKIENRFIVGYGLDYDELGRNLADIYILDD